MANSFSSEMGISEVAEGLGSSIKNIGKQDSNGRTITIAYITGARLRQIPLILRTIGLFIVVIMIFFKNPFSWVDNVFSYDWAIRLSQWEIFSTGTWVMALLTFLVYYMVNFLLNNIYKGIPGVDIYFTRHSKIVYAVKPGSMKFIIDPRVKPYAAVLKKPVVLMMPDVSSNTRDNISMTFRSAILIKVIDTFKLLEQGGFEKFLIQLSKLYGSVVKDRILLTKADEFATFMIDPIPNRTTNERPESQNLGRLEGKEDLTVELLTELSEIDDMNVGNLDLSEPTNPERRELIASLRDLATAYGIEIIDVIPTGNTVADGFLKSLALPLISSITRIRQATDALKEITEEEIDEERTALVAQRELGVTRIAKIIQEILAITETLEDEENKNEIVEAKKTSMRNAISGFLASEISRIDSLKAEVLALEIDTAGYERFESEMRRILNEVEQNVEKVIPIIERSVVESLDEASIIPDMDVMGKLLEISGTQTLLEKLIEDSGTQERNLQDELAALTKKAKEINIPEILKGLEKSLSEGDFGSGVSVDAFSPDRVRALVEKIKKDAALDEGEDTEEQSTEYATA